MASWQGAGAEATPERGYTPEPGMGIGIPARSTHQGYGGQGGTTHSWLQPVSVGPGLLHLPTRQGPHLYKAANPWGRGWGYKEKKGRATPAGCMRVVGAGVACVRRGFPVAHCPRLASARLTAGRRSGLGMLLRSVANEVS